MDDFHVSPDSPEAEEAYLDLLSLYPNEEERENTVIAYRRGVYQWR